MATGRSTWFERALGALTGRGRRGRTRLVTSTPGAPHLAGVDLARLTRDVSIALVPCALVAVASAGGAPWSPLLHLLATFAVALAAGVVWTRVFAEARERARSVGIPATALLFALVLPEGVPLWQVALGASFGVVVGQEVFGGSGHGFVHPVVVGLVFLQFAYPERIAAAPPPDSSVSTATVAVALGAGWLLARRAVRWRVIVGGAAGYLTAAAAFGWRYGDWALDPVLGAFAFGLVFLAADPVTAATTSAGRWFQGALIGALAVLLRVANPSLEQGVAVAILFGNVCAPSVDLAVERLRARRAEIRVG
jgi:Na+-transporting NADH:ubiquinone oxidoreductase subunit B